MSEAYYKWLASAANAAQVPLKEAFEAGYAAGAAMQKEKDAALCYDMLLYTGLDCAAAIREQT